MKEKPKTLQVEIMDSLGIPVDGAVRASINIDLEGVSAKVEYRIHKEPNKLRLKNFKITEVTTDG